jgi:hypothetical protein
LPEEVVSCIEEAAQVLLAMDDQNAAASALHFVDTRVAAQDAALMRFQREEHEAALRALRAEGGKPQTVAEHSGDYDRAVGEAIAALEALVQAGSCTPRT